MDYKVLYDNNADFKAYVDKCCMTYHLSMEEALRHKLVQSVGDHYAEKTGAHYPVTETMSAGCGGAR